MISMADTVTKLKQLRESLDVTQEEFIRRSPALKMRTYARAEAGKTSVRHDTAQEILRVANELLKEAGRGPATLDDLGLKLY